jgi:hypothetical protein
MSDRRIRAARIRDDFPGTRAQMYRLCEPGIEIWLLASGGWLR